jgi:hypothetical protein
VALQDASSIAANKLKIAMGFIGLPSLIDVLFCIGLDFMPVLFLTFAASIE